MENAPWEDNAMTEIDTLRKRREEVLAELSHLEQIRRGSVTDQRVPTTHKNGTKTKRGPYPLYSYKEKGKTVSRRITDPDKVARYREQIEGFRQFQRLTAELRSIGERLSDLALSEEGVKKTSPSRRRSNKTPR